MSLRYRCLVLDHDDTVVDSTATIHHPCFQAFLDEVRPGARIDLETYLLENFTGSFPALCRGRYGLTEAEMARELQFWDAYVAAHVPRAYSGMAAFLARYRAAGGKLCVVSHSLSGNIRRDYRENGLPEPDLIFGWDAPPEQRKPNAYPLREIMRQLRLRDIGGAVVCDFINMSPGEDEKVLECLKMLSKRDFGKPCVHGITKLGLVEISRKRS